MSNVAKKSTRILCKSWRRVCMARVMANIAGSVK